MCRAQRTPCPTGGSDIAGRDIAGRDIAGRTSQDIERNGGAPIEEVLQAKSTGVVVTHTSDGGIAVRIRGTSSFYGGNGPLYVIDDVPMQPGPGGALTGINPHDIESISVLKDPAETGIYGMRGANGVIVIKMKKPGKRPPDA